MRGWPAGELDEVVMYRDAWLCESSRVMESFVSEECGDHCQGIMWN